MQDEDVIGTVMAYNLIFSAITGGVGAFWFHESFWMLSSFCFIALVCVEACLFFVMIVGKAAIDGVRKWMHS